MGIVLFENDAKPAVPAENKYSNDLYSQCDILVGPAQGTNYCGVNIQFFLFVSIFFSFALINTK